MTRPLVLGTLQRTCPVHGLPLRPWHRVGKSECPDSACLYAEPHLCEDHDLECECLEIGTRHGTARRIPACAACNIITEDAARRVNSRHVHAGDAQCSGRCFDRLLFDAWVACVTARLVR